MGGSTVGKLVKKKKLQLHRRGPGFEFVSQVPSLRS